MKETTQQKIKDIVETLNGMEINAPHYETVVLIDGYNVIANGQTIDTINTYTKAKKLLNCAFYDEFGTTSLNTIQN